MRLVGLASAAGISIACAESCTGGGLGAALTAVPGASAVFSGGVIAYSNRVKQDLLGVPQAVLDTEGAVSERCALEMAHGVRRLMKTEVAVSITGIAGPGGGTAEKPVGTVCFGLESAAGGRACTSVFPGSRDDVRRASVEFALELLIQEVGSA